MNRVKEFITESIEELKKTQWPDRKQITRLTAYVIGLSTGVGLFVTLFDYIFKELLTLLINR